MKKSTIISPDLRVKMEVCTSQTIGRNLKKIPKPHIRYFEAFPTKKRQVTINIYQFSGFRHYFASVREEDNPIFYSGRYGERNDTWIRCWDDEIGRGRLISSEGFNSLNAARDWVREKLKEEFPPDRFTYTESGIRRRWLYREGD